MIINSAIDLKITHFFEDNSEPHPTPYYFSTLYLIIRDVKTCLKLDPNKLNDTPINNKTNKNKWPGAEWPAVMTIFSGIDLMGKLLAGNDNRQWGEMSRRFKIFLRRYFRDIKNEPYTEKKELSKILLDFRNALAHSFNLYIDSRNYKLSLINNSNSPLITDKTRDGNNYKQLNVLKLYKNFRSSCEDYYNELTSSSYLKRNFNNMYIRYGVTFMY